MARVRWALSVLDDADSGLAQVLSSVRTLGDLAGAGLLEEERCEKRIVSSAAVASMDRLDLESVLASHFFAVMSR